MANTELIKKLRDLTQAGVMDAKKALDENGDDIEAAIQWLREKGIAKAAKKASAVATEGLAKVYIHGNYAAIIEVNSETDFVAANEAFKELVDDIGLSLVESGQNDLEKALQLLTSKDVTIDYACKELTGKIGEKIALRRYELLQKNDNEIFAYYEHTNGKIAVLLIIDKEIDPVVAKDIAMHAAAMAPKFLNETKVDPEWLANETNILREQTIAEGKPIERADMIVKGRVNKLLAEVTLEAQQFVKDSSVTVKQHINRNNGNLIHYVRYQVGEGIEKKIVDFAAEVAAQMK